MAHFKLLRYTLLLFVLMKTSRSQVPCAGGGSKIIFGLPSPGLEQRALGVGDGTIPDASLSASSYWSNLAGYGARRGRLNGVYEAGIGQGAWCNAGRGESDPWIQVELNGVTMVTGVGTQGRSDPPDTTYNQWVPSYEVGCSVDGVNFDKISRQSGECNSTSFVGNSDKNTVVINQLNVPYLCRYVRIYPLTFNDFICMRFEVYGY